MRRTSTLDPRIRWLLIIVALGYVVYLLSPVLTPFLIAALFAYLFDPLADRMESWRIGRWSLGRGAAVTLIFLGMSLVGVVIVLGLIPLIERQVASLAGQIPLWAAWLEDTAVPWLAGRFNLDPAALDPGQWLSVLQEHWKEAGGVAASVMGVLTQSGAALVGWAINLVVAPVVAFYLLRDWDTLVGHIRATIPRHVEPTVVELARRSDRVLSGFMRGQLAVMLALALFYGVALWMVGINVGPLIGMIAGLISFVPYLGAITGVLLGVVAALVEYQDMHHVVLVLVVFGVGQLLESYVLVPRLVGDKIGLHPVAVIFAVLAGGELLGFTGVLLGLPLAAVVMVLLRYGYERYTQSDLYAGGATDAAAREPVEVSSSGQTDGE